MILSTTILHLNQVRDICLRLSNQQLAKPLSVLNGSSIGDHIRHILEFYLCLIKVGKDQTLNYDDRERNRELATDRLKCLKKIEHIISCLSDRNLDREIYSMPRGETPIASKINYSMNNDHLSVSVMTTFDRELVFNIEHTLHHLAIIKIANLTLEDPIIINEQVGVAISTLRNQNKKSALACAQ